MRKLKGENRYTEIGAIFCHNLWRAPALGRAAGGQISPVAVVRRCATGGSGEFCAACG